MGENTPESPLECTLQVCPSNQIILWGIRRNSIGPWPFLTLSAALPMNARCSRFEIYPSGRISGQVGGVIQLPFTDNNPSKWPIILMVLVFPLELNSVDSFCRLSGQEKARKSSVIQVVLGWLPNWRKWWVVPAMNSQETQWIRWPFWCGFRSEWLLSIVFAISQRVV